MKTTAKFDIAGCWSVMLHSVEQWRWVALAKEWNNMGEQLAQCFTIVRTARPTMRRCQQAKMEHSGLRSVTVCTAQQVFQTFSSALGVCNEIPFQPLSAKSPPVRASWEITHRNALEGKKFQDGGSLNGNKNEII